MTGGEVVIKQNHHEHAVHAPGLEGDIHVDLDTDSPGAVVSAPNNVGIVYEDERNVEDGDDEDLRADGGVAAAPSRTNVTMGGMGMANWHAKFAFYGGALSLFVGGSVMALNAAAGLLLALVGAFIATIGGRLLWGGQRA